MLDSKHALIPLKKQSNILRNPYLLYEGRQMLIIRRTDLESEIGKL